MKKWLEYLVSELFSNRKCRGLGPWLGRPRLLWLMVNQGARGGGSSSEIGLVATLKHGSSPAGLQQREGKHGNLGSGLTGARAAVERRHDGGDERWWLELSARVKEGARELEREGKRGGEGQGCSSPFYRARREAEVAGIGGVAAVNGVLNGAITGVKEGGNAAE
jgi:hypothetical protein